MSQYCHKKRKLNKLEQKKLHQKDKDVNFDTQILHWRNLCEFVRSKTGQRIKICLSIYISGGSVSTSIKQARHLAETVKVSRDSHYNTERDISTGDWTVFLNSCNVPLLGEMNDVMVGGDSR